MKTHHSDILTTNEAILSPEERGGKIYEDLGTYAQTAVKLGYLKPELVQIPPGKKTIPYYFEKELYAIKNKYWEKIVQFKRILPPLIFLPDYITFKVRWNKMIGGFSRNEKPIYKERVYASCSFKDSCFWTPEGGIPPYNKKLTYFLNDFDLTEDRVKRIECFLKIKCAPEAGIEDMQIQLQNKINDYKAKLNHKPIKNKEREITKMAAENNENVSTETNNSELQGNKLEVIKGYITSDPKEYMKKDGLPYARFSFCKPKWQQTPNGEFKEIDKEYYSVFVSSKANQIQFQNTMNCLKAGDKLVVQGYKQVVMNEATNQEENCFNTTYIAFNFNQFLPKRLLQATKNINENNSEINNLDKQMQENIDNALDNEIDQMRHISSPNKTVDKTITKGK